MYHITRCPNCHTSFRVTDAHLTAFEGKVRCGRCAFVFDALSHLLGEPTQTIHISPPAAAAEPATPMAEALNTIEAAMVTAHEQDDEAAIYGLDSMASQLEAAAEAERDDADDSLASQSLQQLASALALDQPSATPSAEADPWAAYEPASEPTAVAPDPAATAEPELSAEALVAELEVIEIRPVAEASQSEESASLFAEAGDHGYRPILTKEDEALLRVPARPSPWRWLWSIPAMLAGIALLGQLAFFYRTDLAVQLPGIAPRLARFCAMTGCRLSLPARAQYLRTEWNELVSLPEHPNLIQLNATLRNQAAFAQALPLLELTLTDDNDRVVARKVFGVKEYLAPLADGTPAPRPDDLPANGELRVFLQLDLGDMRSSGYSLNWFYPQAN